MALRDARRWGEAHADLARLPVVLAELVGQKVEVRLRRVDVIAPGGLPSSHAGGARGTAVAVAPADAPSLERAAVVQVEPALADALAACLLKRRAPALRRHDEAVAAAVAGAFAALVTSALRRAHAGIAMRVLAAGPAPALEFDVAALGQERIAVALTVLLGDDAFEARLQLPRLTASTAPDVAWDARALGALGVAALSLPVVAHALWATTLEVASLEAGDALLLPGWRLVRQAEGGGQPARLTGPVILAAPSASTGVVARLGEDGRLVLGGDVVPLCAAEAEMTDAADTSGIIEAIGEVPVVVRVEIGEASMLAREWASLARGDVLALGRRVGESVTLRVGGVPVARGELVEIEGDVGVRIVERLPGGGAQR
jgi:flagellar motor switch/type III secretory pathway protein FliN